MHEPESRFGRLMCGRKAGFRVAPALRSGLARNDGVGVAVYYLNRHPDESRDPQNSEPILWAPTFVGVTAALSGDNACGLLHSSKLIPQRRLPVELKTVDEGDVAEVSDTIMGVYLQSTIIHPHPSKKSGQKGCRLLLTVFSENEKLHFVHLFHMMAHLVPMHAHFRTRIALAHHIVSFRGFTK